jgi:hypothetical protein
VSNLNTQRLGLFLVMGLGILFALFAGNYVAEEDYTPIAIVLGGLVAITLVFSVGTNAYLLIPMCWPLIGSIHLLPLPFNVRQLAMIFGSVIFISGVIFKRGGGKKVPFDALDLWVWINVVYLVTVFFRNPVGINALGGDRVGGRPYVDVALGFMAYLILRRETLSPKLAGLIPLVWLGGDLVNTLGGLVGLYLPSIGSQIGMLYSGFLPSFDKEQVEAIAGEDRLVSLQGAGATLALYIICSVNPTHLIRPQNLGKLLGYLLGVVLIMLSGFRNAIFNVFLMTAFGAMMRDRFIGIVKVMVIVLLGALAGILFSYSSINLPWTFQRTLSFLPGNWDPTAVAAAKDSSEWRYEMWRLAMSTDRYIHNKLLGDGFGMSRKDYERSLDAISGGVGFIGENANQERFMVSGQFHSGPVSSIRFVGYVGLVLFLILAIIVAKSAFQLIEEGRGTPYQFITLFIGIPILIYPIFFLFVFGGYENDIINVLFYVGMIKMINSSLKKYYETSEKSKVLYSVTNPLL